MTVTAVAVAVASSNTYIRFNLSNVYGYAVVGTNENTIYYPSCVLPTKYTYVEVRGGSRHAIPRRAAPRRLARSKLPALANE